MSRVPSAALLLVALLGCRPTDPGPDPDTDETDTDPGDDRLEVAGSLRNLQDGTALGGVTIRYYEQDNPDLPPDRMVATDAIGGFVVQTRACEPFTLEVMDLPGVALGAMWRHGVVADARTSLVRYSLSPSAAEALADAAELAWDLRSPIVLGQVLDGDGQPLEGATITLSRDGSPVEGVTVRYGRDARTPDPTLDATEGSAWFFAFGVPRGRTNVAAWSEDAEIAGDLVMTTDNSVLLFVTLVDGIADGIRWPEGCQGD